MLSNLFLSCAVFSELLDHFPWAMYWQHGQSVHKSVQGVIGSIALQHDLTELEGMYFPVRNENPAILCYGPVYSARQQPSY